MENRDIWHAVRFSRSEYDLLCEKAEKDSACRTNTGKVNLSRYIRKCVFSEEVSGRLSKAVRDTELKNLTYQIRKIGVNINQATKKINSGYYDLNTCMQLQQGLQEVNLKMEQIIESMKEE